MKGWYEKIHTTLFYSNYPSASLRRESALCLGLHEGRYEVDHFGNATSRSHWPMQIT